MAPVHDARVASGRPTGPIPGIVGRYTVSYTRDGAAQPLIDNLFVFDVGANIAEEWTAEMVYETFEMRYEPTVCSRSRTTSPSAVLTSYK